MSFVKPASLPMWLVSTGDLCLGVCLTGVSACLKLSVVIALLINSLILYSSPSELPLKSPNIRWLRDFREVFSRERISFRLNPVLQVSHQHLYLCALCIKPQFSSRELSQWIKITQTLELNDFGATYWENSLAHEVINGLNLTFLKKVYLCLLTLKWMVC
jgi:hypothetical protein